MNDSISVFRAIEQYEIMLRLSISTFFQDWVIWGYLTEKIRPRKKQTGPKFIVRFRVFAIK